MIINVEKTLDYIYNLNMFMRHKRYKDAQQFWEICRLALNRNVWQGSWEFDVNVLQM